MADYVGNTTVFKILTHDIGKDTLKNAVSVTTAAWANAEISNEGDTFAASAKWYGFTALINMAAHGAIDAGAYYLTGSNPTKKLATDQKVENLETKFDNSLEDMTKEVEELDAKVEVLGATTYVVSAVSAEAFNRATDAKSEIKALQTQVDSQQAQSNQTQNFVCELFQKMEIMSQKMEIMSQNMESMNQKIGALEAIIAGRDGGVMGGGPGNQPQNGEGVGNLSVAAELNPVDLNQSQLGNGSCLGFNFK